jgi:hypothetical protein
MPVVSLAQTVYKSCTDTSNISKQTETWFHMTHVTLEFHRERPKLFMSLWYVWHKPCTYLASRLALSPNGPIRASNWATSPRSTICCVQNVFWAYGTFSANRAPILHWYLQCLQTEGNENLDEPRHLGFPSGASKMIFEPMVRSVQTMHLCCVKIRTISKWTKKSFQLSPVTKEYHQVHPKLFLSLRYLWRKPCTCHASKWTEMRFHMTHVM